MCTMCQPRKQQVPGWNPIVYLNEKKLDLEVGIVVYDGEAPKKTRCLAGIQLCTLTKKSWSSKLESMCTMCQFRKNRFLVGIQVCTLSKKHGFVSWNRCVRCASFEKKKQVHGWIPIVYLNEKQLGLGVGIDVYDVPAPKKTGPWLESNCVP
jgi:hypothetical protein